MKNSTKHLIRVLVFFGVLLSFILAFAPPTEAHPHNETPLLQYFDISEFRDRTDPTAKVKMNRHFLLKLDELRRRCGFPINIRSGYRSPNHIDERNKRTPGTHTKGIAVDIMVNDDYHRSRIIRHATALGFRGIGIYPLHIHLDTRITHNVIWVRDKYIINHSRDSPRR